MEEKINIVELIKDCPKGMELDCAIYDNIVFDGVQDYGEYPIKVVTNDGEKYLYLTKYGCTSENKNAKCVIFPKGKTTWEGFQRPFKDGDIVYYNDTISIFKEWGDATLFRAYACTYIYCEEIIDVNVPLFGKSIRREARLATKEEKQKLFQSIKNNGYKWNEETKTLEELIGPKFKVGDRISINNNLNKNKKMRTIKFRGKDIETGEWLDGDLIQRMGCMPGIIFPYERNGKVCYAECAVERETVGQFTGLFDKNGDQIYEGDIVVWGENDCKSAPLVVLFKYGSFGYTYVEDWFHSFAGNINFTFNPLNTDKRFEIIGNIHDNPELLKVVQNDSKKNLKNHW